MKTTTFNWEIIGHQRQLNFLERCINSGRIAHSYLFYGLSNLGKATLAKKLGQILQCQTKNGILPCGQCLSCQYFNQGIHPDVYLVGKKDEKKNTSIDQIRELQRNLSFKPLLGGYKIAIIDEAENLNEAAVSSLLKTLEEPAPKTIIILVSSQINTLPKTIQSRSQLIHFLPLQTAELAQYFLEPRNIDPELAKSIIHLSNYRPGLFIDFLNNPKKIDLYFDRLNNFLDLLASDANSRLRKLDKLLSKKEKFIDQVEDDLAMLSSWKLAARDLLLIKNSGTNLGDQKFTQKLQSVACGYSLADIGKIIIRIVNLEKLLALNINPKIAFENLILNL